MLIFAPHDVTKNPPYCNMHFISCRNLLIYITPVLQRKVFSMLLFGIKRDGYLFLGNTENPMPIIHHLTTTSKEWKIYKNIEVKRALHLDGFAMPQMIGVSEKQSTFKGITVKEKAPNILVEPLYADLLREMDYLAVCIDDNNQVVKTYGNTTKYILQKNFNLNLADVLPGPLKVVFNTLSLRVRKDNKKDSLHNVKVKYNKTFINVSLAITPLHNKTLLPDG